MNTAPKYLVRDNDRAFGAVFKAPENIVLSRNEVIRTPSGERTWRGTFWNHSDSLYTDLDTVVLPLDKDGKPVGQARGATVSIPERHSTSRRRCLPKRCVCRLSDALDD